MYSGRLGTRIPRIAGIITLDIRAAQITRLVDEGARFAHPSRGIGFRPAMLDRIMDPVNTAGEHEGKNDKPQRETDKEFIPSPAEACSERRARYVEYLGNGRNRKTRVGFGGSCSDSSSRRRGRYEELLFLLLFVVRA